MHELAPLIKDLAVILGIAGIVTLIFQKIRQPVVLGYLIAGIIIGPYTPPYSLVSDIPNIKVIAELGVIFLMFSLGLDFSFHKLKRVGFSSTVTGFIEVLLMLLVGFLTGRMIGWSFIDSLFLGAALSISSTTIIIKALEELNLKRKHFSEIIFGVLIVEDLLAILLLVALSTVVVTANIFSTAMAWAALKLVLVVGSWFLIGYFIVPVIFRRLMQYISNETLTIISIALCLTLVSIAAYFNYSVALGAFIMGSILAETAQAQRIEDLIRPIRDIFAAVFFVSVGMLIDPSIIFQQWHIVLLITVITVIGKIITSGLGTFLTGQSISTSLRIGFSLAQIGEFSFIIAGLGIALGATNKSLYPIIVAISGITTFTTPYLIRLSGYLSKLLEEKLSPSVKYFLESYSVWLYRTRADRKRQSIYHKAVVRFIINAIVVAIIFNICQHLLEPQLRFIFTREWVIELISWTTAMIASSPFIWAMLYAFRISPTDKKIKFSPLMMIAWIAALTEISIFSIAYFHTWLIAILLIILTIAVLTLLYNKLEKSYHWFEKRLITNLSQLQEFSHTQFEELAPWDTYLVQLPVSYDSEVVGKTLEECKLRQDFGINIVAIHRGSKTLLAPRGNERLWPGDNLIVLGNDEQIDRFKTIAEKISPAENNYSLENFTLEAILLKNNHPLIGKSIRDSNIREETSGLVVGLERKGIRILNPDPATILEEKDLVFIVGKAELLANLNKI